MTYRRERGVTLIELLIAMAILAIVSGLTISSWAAFVERNKHRRIVLTYHQAFEYARWKAASSKNLVTVCPLGKGSTCIDDWNLPVSVFPDANNDKKPDSGQVWRRVDPPAKPYSVKSRTAKRGYLQFSSSGMTHGGSGGLVLCPSQPSAGRKISYMAVNKGGRFRSQSVDSHIGSIKLKWGALIECPHTSS
ncbi:pilus assembly FimT family protein [Marinobacter goseongensis]|uniref:pilus assembly FimT family protein n=1 Tax=Marinobacter goseongensis TaxID=453838 RepID=UPI0020058491|nr:GspH/FimT family pseudopilin [Marinobacter goseongensis]MCK7553170.1 GspH/FimT family pseudopilin [Marinobacter goseongensis]